MVPHFEEVGIKCSHLGLSGHPVYRDIVKTSMMTFSTKAQLYLSYQLCVNSNNFSILFSARTEQQR